MNSPLLSRAALVGAVLFLFPNFSRSAETAPFYLHDGDKVVFYGDSITDQRLYTTFTETYVVTRFPNLKVGFVHSGWGGDRVTGGGGGPIDLRLDRDVFAYQPTVVTIMLGMNDGGYRAFDQTLSDTYQHGYEHILDRLQGQLPGVRLTLIQPSPYDDVTQPVGFPGGYNAVLQQYSQFVKGLAAQKQLTTADFNTAVVDLLTKAKQADPVLAQKIIPGRVHPSPAGHLIMAETLLKAWNAPSLVAAVEIDAAQAKVVRADNSKIDDLKAGAALSWTETDAALPMPVDLDDKVIALVLASSDFTAALNQEPLKVTGLKAPYYELKIDDETAGVFSRDELARGVNLALHSTPMMDQAAAVHQLTLQHDNLHFERWRAFQVPLLDKHDDAVTAALPPLLAALDAAEQRVVDQQHAQAQPLPHHFQLTPQQTAAVPPVVIPPDPVLPANLGPNLALHKKYVSSNPNVQGWDGGLTDGSWTAGPGTTYATDNHPEFPKSVTIDLEKPEPIACVLVGVPPFGSTRTVRVSLSTDNQTFTPVGSYTFPQSAAVKHLYSFPPTTARYLRLTYQNHYAKVVQFPVEYAFTTEVEAYAPVAP